MGELMTAQVTRTFSDVAEADQEGKVVDEDTYLIGLDHPPFICSERFVDEMAYNLCPPDYLARDYIKEMANLDNSAPGVWDSLDFYDEYLKFIKRDHKAQEELTNIKLMKKSRDVCIVCGDSLYRTCIRRVIYEYLQGET